MKNVEFPWVLTFGISTNKGRVSSRSETSGKAWEFGRESRNVRRIRDFLENKKVREKSRKCLSMQIFNIKKKKNHMHAEMCAVELHMAISCSYM